MLLINILYWSIRLLWRWSATNFKFSIILIFSVWRLLFFKITLWYLIFLNYTSGCRWLTSVQLTWLFQFFFNLSNSIFNLVKFSFTHLFTNPCHRWEELLKFMRFVIDWCLFEYLCYFWLGERYLKIFAKFHIFT